MEVHDIFLDNLPNIDLHGFDRESARVITNDFVDEASKLGYDKFVIIHGIGTGVVKDAVHQTLSKNKKVQFYKVNSQNSGCTVVTLNKKITKIPKQQKNKWIFTYSLVWL